MWIKPAIEFPHFGWMKMKEKLSTSKETHLQQIIHVTGATSGSSSLVKCISQHGIRPGSLMDEIVQNCDTSVALKQSPRRYRHNGLHG